MMQIVACVHLWLLWLLTLLNTKWTESLFSQIFLCIWIIYHCIYQVYHTGRPPLFITQCVVWVCLWQLRLFTLLNTNWIESLFLQIFLCIWMINPLHLCCFIASFHINCFTFFVFFSMNLILFLLCFHLAWMYHHSLLEHYIDNYPQGLVFRHMLHWLPHLSVAAFLCLLITLTFISVNLWSISCFVC